VANIDIWPTVLDLVGLPALPYAEGQSLVPLILAADGASPAPPELEGRALFAQLDRSWGRTSAASDEIISIRQEPYRFIYPRDRPQEAELFDHASDPEEQTDLSQVEVEMTQRFSGQVADFLARPHRGWENPEVEIDEMMRAQLRALGYSLPPSDALEAARRRVEAERARAGGRWNE
jgi:arylsulfatase A-like enzyme